jgi:hypothetical protein
LREQGIGGQPPDEGELLEEFRQVGLEGFRFGGLPVGDGVLGQTELDLVGEDVEQVDRVAGGIVARFARLAIDSGDLAVTVGDRAAEPLGKGLQESGADRLAASL